MKKFLCVIVALSMLMLVSISNAEEIVRDLPEEEIVRDLADGEYEEIGEGDVYIATAGGTSKDGNVPVIYAEPDLILVQIGLNAWGFNGEALSFVYVDGMILDKIQLSNSQTSITLSGEQLASGIHTVEVVQYENDDPSCDMIAYRVMCYEIRMK